MMHIIAAKQINQQISIVTAGMLAALIIVFHVTLRGGCEPMLGTTVLVVSIIISTFKLQYM